MCDETFKKNSEEAMELARNGGAARAKSNTIKIKEVQKEVLDLKKKIDKVTASRVASQQ